MLILLPIVDLILLAIFLIDPGSEQNENPHENWQGQILLAIGIWGAYLVLQTEVFSALRMIAMWPLAIAWGLPGLILLAFNIKCGNIRRGSELLRVQIKSWSILEAGFFTGFVLLSLMLLSVAFAAPTNNVDAMNYHMPRVLQWAQNRSLAHFPTPHASQNIRPYWAEAVILHFRVLWGDDQPAGLVQWLTMVSSLIATSGIARLLGGDRKVQWLTTVLAFSIPMGLLQSTTTQNDYVSAFWVVSLAYFVVLSRKRALSRLELSGLGLSLGLGMLTKGTFFPYAAPLMVWFFIGHLTDGQWKQGLAQGILMLSIVIALNGLFWARNIQSTGGPYGSFNPLRYLKELVPERTVVPGPNSFVNQDSLEIVHFHADVAAVTLDRIETSGSNLGGILPLNSGLPDDSHLVTMARLIAMNFVSPFSAFNQAYFSVLRSMPALFPEHYVQKLEIAAWNHEDTAGSPVHMVLVLIAMVVGSISGIRGRLKNGLIYSLVLAASFILVALIGSGIDIFVIRYQLGFLLLGVPLVGLVFPRSDTWMNLAIISFMLYSIPYILFSNMRPVIGRTPWPTRVPSVFTAEKNTLLFAINPESRDEYEQIAKLISEEECNDVGLGYYERNLEYQTWHLLNAPDSGVVMNHLVSLTEFESYSDLDFEPCAVICTNCDAVSQDRMLPTYSDYGSLKLLMLEVEGD